MQQTEVPGSRAISGIFWGVAQSWGGKIIVFLLFIVLARILTPLEFGVVSAASSVLLMITQFAEFGFSDAVVQRRKLDQADINLPCLFSLTLAFILSGLLFVQSSKIEELLKVAGLAPVLKVMSVIGPLTILSQFQEMVFRRNLLYKQLALRVFVANSLAGAVAVIAAIAGAGVWSLVVQAVGTVVISVCWLWRRPQWRPSLDFRWSSFFEIKKFAASIVSTRVLDFVSTRTIEFVIVSFSGPAVLGLYSAGARLYQTLMQLFQGALSDVALSLLSRIAEDRAKTRSVYIETSSLSAILASPVFVMIAVASQEICEILLGTKWIGVELVARPLLLVGAVLCVQFINSTYLSACGRPSLVLLMGAFKAPIVVAAIYWARGDGIGDLVAVYCLAQLVTTPFSFGFVLKVLELSPIVVIKRLGPIFLCLIAAYFLASAARLQLIDHVPSLLFRACIVCALFLVLCYSLLFGLARTQMFESIEFVKNRIRRK